MEIRRSKSNRFFMFAVAFILTVSMTGTLLPSVSHAAPVSKYGKDVDKLIEVIGTQDIQGDAQKEAAKVTDYVSTHFPDTADVETEIDGVKGMKYVDAMNPYGFRNSGSVYEHQCAQWLAEEMQDLGLEAGGKDGSYFDKITVDGWQFDGAKFSMDGVTMEDPICSYMSTYDGTIEDAEIVYLGDLEKDIDVNKYGTPISGMKEWYDAYYAEHEGVFDMSGKIVVADINQESAWITPFYMEAANQKAEGIITFSSQFCNEDGSLRGDCWDNAVQIQDICSEDLGIACVAISRNDGFKIKEQIKNAYEADITPTATLTVKSTVKLQGERAKPDATGYKLNEALNVVGMIKGSGNTGQQIVVSGHYDKYWYGYNDDNAALGTVFGIAKALKDANYQPINDIYFVCHAAEEWGQSGIENDWAVGSWKEITEARPEFQGTTIAMINFELPSMTIEDRFASNLEENPIDGTTTIGVGGSAGRECAPILEAFTDTSAYGNIEASVADSTGKNIDQRYLRATTGVLSDEAGWQFYGVPAYTLRALTGETNECTIYHTPYDSVTNYQPEAMEYVLKAASALAEYVDQQPAVALSGQYNIKNKESKTDNYGDLSSAFGVLTNNHKKDIYNMGDVAGELGIDATAYYKAIESYGDAFDTYNEYAVALNESYTKARDENATDYELNKLYKAGIALNKVGLAAFKKYQDEMLVVGQTDTLIRSEDLAWNYGSLKTAANMFYYASLYEPTDPAYAEYVEYAIGTVGGDMAGYGGSPWGINWSNALQAVSFSVDVAVDYSTRVVRAPELKQRAGMNGNRTFKHEPSQVITSQYAFAEAYCGECANAESWSETCATEVADLGEELKAAAARETKALNDISEMLDVNYDYIYYEGEQNKVIEEQGKTIEEQAAQIAALTKMVQDLSFKMAKPSITVKNVKTKSIKVSCSKADAVKYTVFYKTTAAKKWTKKNTTKKTLTLKKLKKGKTYQIKVAAYNENGASITSAVKKVKIKK